MSEQQITESANESVNDSHFASLKPEQFIRGATPDDIEQQCLKLCRAYIGASWNDASGVDDIAVKRCTGGISNQIYRVQLKDSVVLRSKAENDPQSLDVIIKLYQSKELKSTHKDDDERLNDTIVLTTLSEVGLGPKVFGIFKGGLVQAYQKHTIFNLAKQNDTELLGKIAHSMARIHHLKVPIRKHTNWQIKQAEEMLADVLTRVPIYDLFKEWHLEMLNKFDVQIEVQRMKELISGFRYPLVLCHNDITGSNILVTEPERKVSIIDLEYCAYGCRGYDMSVFHAQWGSEPHQFDNFGMPEDWVMQRFIKLYIEACEKINPGYASKPENSPEQILSETKHYFLVYLLFWVVFMLHQHITIIDALPFDRKRNFKFSELYYGKYLSTKQRLIDDGTIEEF